MQSKIFSHFQARGLSYLEDSQKIPWKWIKNFEMNAIGSVVKEFNGKSILDLGCGAGCYLNLWSKGDPSKITLVDFSSKMLAKVDTSQITIHCEDIETFRRSEQYDLVFMLGVGEFLSNFEKVLNNIHEMTHKESEILIMLPKLNIGGQIYFLYHYLFHGIRPVLYNRTSLTNICAKANFRLVSWKTVLPFNQLVVLKKGL